MEKATKSDIVKAVRTPRIGRQPGKAEPILRCNPCHRRKGR
jgi:hypothetical protein